ncbi:MAG TPA: hypothetical protein VGO93_28300 [Candidatus Xenobia bacterium]|jgi:hypothetical protein
MADIKLDNLKDPSQVLDSQAMKNIYGGAGLDNGSVPLSDPGATQSPVATNDPNQVPIVTLGPDGQLPGQGDAGKSGGGGGGGSCQL